MQPYSQEISYTRLREIAQEYAMNFLTKFACRHHSTKKNYHERRGTQFLKVAVVLSPLKLLFVCRVSIQDGDDDGFEIQTMIIAGSGRKCIGFKLNCNIIP